MKIAKEIAAALCENGIHRGALMDEEVSYIIAENLEPVRDVLKEIHDMYVVSGLHVGEKLDAALALFEDS